MFDLPTLNLNTPHLQIPTLWGHGYTDEFGSRGEMNVRESFRDSIEKEIE